MWQGRDEVVAGIPDEELLPVIASHVLRPKMAIPEVGYSAVCNDTEGNPIGLFQVDADAA